MPAPTVLGGRAVALEHLADERRLAGGVEVVGARRRRRPRRPAPPQRTNGPTVVTSTSPGSTSARTLGGSATSARRSRARRQLGRQLARAARALRAASTGCMPRSTMASAARRPVYPVAPKSTMRPGTLASWAALLEHRAHPRHGLRHRALHALQVPAGERDQPHRGLGHHGGVALSFSSRPISPKKSPGPRSATCSPPREHLGLALLDGQELVGEVALADELPPSSTLTSWANGRSAEALRRGPSGTTESTSVGWDPTLVLLARRTRRDSIRLIATAAYCVLTLRDLQAHRMRIAVVGAGISGLVGATCSTKATTSPSSRPTTTRAATATRSAWTPHDETHHVDTGFIVHNDRNYPRLRAAAGERGALPRSRLRDELLRERRSRRARVQRLLGKWVVRESREPGESLLPPDGPRPPPLQPRGPGARGPERERAKPRAVPRRGRLLALLRRPAPRAPGLGCVVGGPGPPCGDFPASLLAEFFANHGMFGFSGRPRLARGQRRLGTLRRAADPRLLTQPAAPYAGAAAWSDSTT